MTKSSAGKGDSPRNCFSKQFKDNYEEINWSKVSCNKVSKYPEHLKELLEALYDSTFDSEVEPSSKNSMNVWTMLKATTNDTHKIKDFDIYPKNKKRAKLFHKYNLDNSVREMYIWEVTEMMYNYIPF